MSVWIRTITILMSLLLLHLNSLLYAQRAGTMNLERIVREAGMIFSGEVIAVETGERFSSMNLYATHYTFRVDEGIYGIENDTVTIAQYGGEAAGKSFYPRGVPRFRQGENVLVFLYPLSDIGMTSAVGMTQGKFTVRNLGDTRKKGVSNSQGNESLFRGIRNQALIANPKWLTTRKPGELDYAEFALTVRNLVEHLKN